MGIKNLFNKNREKEEVIEKVNEDDNKEYEDDSTESSIYDDDSDIYGNSDTNISESIYEQQDNTEETDAQSEIYESKAEDSEIEEISVDKKIDEKLKSLASNGCNIVVTGCKGSGVTSVAYNMASMLARLGYRTLIVDFDTVDRAMSYVSEDTYRCLGADSMALEGAINQGMHLGRAVSIVKNNLYIIGLGAAIDAYEFDQTLKVEAVSRFMSDVKSQFQFVVYDTPIENIIKYCKDIAVMSDKVALVSEASTSGAMKTITAMMNIEDESLMQTFFNKCTLICNKVKESNSIMGAKAKSARAIAKCMDNVVKDLTGESIGHYFSNMRGFAEVAWSDKYDEQWFRKGSMCNKKEIAMEYSRLLVNLI